MVTWSKNNTRVRHEIFVVHACLCPCLPLLYQLSLFRDLDSGCISTPPPTPWRGLAYHLWTTPFLTLKCFVWITYFMCMGVFCLYVCMCTLCLQYPQRSEEGIRCPGIRVTESWEPLCGCQESSLGPPQEQTMFLTIEPSCPLTSFKIQFKVTGNKSKKWTNWMRKKLYGKRHS